ncbi:hypothetical protein DFP73DRAFT_602296 [Morchella snyderi]|nr:hypothetical protein DFP73DRAFT_602296 [Morchella snyderi]
MVDGRNGWMFFEFGRKYSNLNNPDYTIDDAIYLLLMAFYLDKAFLPSPCWMITGAMARVCQDIGIYRHTPSGLYDDITVECRTRLFWAAYIQDRKISMKLGRPIIFLDQHIDVGLPGLPVANMIDHQDDFNDQETETSLQVFKATIYIAKASENLLNIELKQNGGEEDVKHLQNIDEMLKKAWEVFPSEMTDLRRSDVLDLPAVRPLFHLQHSRIILYRYFTDFTGTPSLLREFRTFCLAQSIQVAKITAHILSRVIKNPGFDRIFGLRTDELVLIHTFRAATVLLLGHYCNDRSLLDVTTDEVGVCARALKSAARSHSLGQKLLELFQNFAKMFGYQTGVTGELSHPIPEASDTIDEKLEEIHGVSTPKGPWDNVESSSAVATPQYNNAVYGGYHTLQGNTPRWIPTTNISLVPTYQQLLHTSQPVTQPPPLPHPLPLPHTLPHPQSQSQEHHQTHSGLIFVDPGIGGAGLPTSVEENPQGSLPDQQSPMPHQINWDVYQQVLTFDPNFEVYMGGPSHRRFLYDRGE